MWKKLKKIAYLYRQDWRRIFKNPLALGLVLALMIIPSLYAWFNIEALWDPYSNASELPIAVYSADEKAALEGKTINIGDEVIKNLHQNKQLGWHFVHSKHELTEGVKSGKYYAGIYLPKNFSKDLLSFTKGDIKKPEIDYYVNKKINAVAPNITVKGASSLQETITNEFIKTVSSTLLKAFNQLGYDIDAHAVDLEKVKNLVLTTNDHLDEINGYLAQVTDLKAKMPEMENKLAQANQFITYLPQVDALSKKVIELNQKMPALKNEAGVILTLQQKIPEIQNAGKQVAMVDSDFDQIASTMNEGINEARSGVEVIQKVQDILPQIDQMTTDATEAAAKTQSGAEAIKADLPELEAGVAAGLSSVDTVAKFIANNSGTWAQAVKNSPLTQAQKDSLKQQLDSQIASAENVQAFLAGLITAFEKQPGDWTKVIEKLKTAEADLALAKEALTQARALVDQDTPENRAKLAQALEEAGEKAQKVSAAIQSIDQNALQQGIAAILDAGIAGLSDAQSVLAAAQKIDLATLLNQTKATIKNALALLEKYQQELPAIKTEIHDANTLLNGHMDSIVSGINTGAALYQQELPSVEQQLSQAATFMQKDWPGIESDLTNTLTLLNEKFPTVEKAVDFADEMIQNDWPTIQDGIKKAAAAIQKGENEVDLGQLIKLLKTDADQESDFIAKPVQLKENNLYNIPTYGSASAPFYTALCLWVGALLFASVATTKVYLEKEDRGRFTLREQYLARMLTFYTMGLAQALIVVLGNVFLLKAYTVSPGWSLIFSLLISFAFTSLLYSLVANLGNIGKGLAVIILVLSISGGGGNFPIQLSGKFFQRINPFLPFTHAVNLLREASGGIYWPNAYKYILIILFVGIFFAVLGAVLYPWLSRQTEKLAQRSHQSHLFH